VGVPQGSVEVTDERFEPFGVAEAQLMSGRKLLRSAADLLRGGIDRVGGRFLLPGGENDSSSIKAADASARLLGRPGRRPARSP
jgi:hypothetical protein